MIAAATTWPDAFMVVAAICAITFILFILLWGGR